MLSMIACLLNAISIMFGGGGNMINLTKVVCVVARGILTLAHLFTHGWIALKVQ